MKNKSREDEEKEINSDGTKAMKNPRHVIIIIKFSFFPLSQSQIDLNRSIIPSDASSTSDDVNSASKLFQELESVEKQYENIVGRLPSECSEMSSADNGVHNGLILPPAMRRPIMAKCHGPWTVVQKREDGSVDFNRSWEEYATGFGKLLLNYDDANHSATISFFHPGDPEGELWIGNEVLHHLTKDNCTKLRIVIQDLQNNTWYADYESFSIASRAEGYRIDFSGYSGNASNTLEYQNHMKFSSIDVDLDISKNHCADEYEVRQTSDPLKVGEHSNIVSPFFFFLGWMVSLKFYKLFSV